MASISFTGYLIWVSWQDYREMMVVRYSHCLGLVAVIILTVLNRQAIKAQPMAYLAGLIMVLLVQIVAYKCRLYGMADILVFFMCGLYFLVTKGPELYLIAYIMVPAVSGVLLLIVQILKKNVRGVHLHRPVAYIPYICVAFVLTNVVV